MSRKKNSLVDEKVRDTALITAAINRGVREAVLQHARAGKPVASWRDGKVVWIEPSEILDLYSSRAEPEPEAGSNGNNI